MVRCTDCGADHYPGTLFCLECGRTLIGADSDSELTLQLGITSPLANSKPLLSDNHDDGVVGDFGHIVFFIPSSGRQVKLKLNGKIQIGRSDPRQDFRPGLDLTPDSRIEHGVSRSHALVEHAKNNIVVVDLGSTNGTCLNHYRLKPTIPYPLNDGDELRLGRLLVRVFFKL